MRRKHSEFLLLMVLSFQLIGWQSVSAQTGVRQPHEPCDTFKSAPFLRYSELAIHYSKEHKQAFWVAYTLEAEELFLQAPINRKEEDLFGADPDMNDVKKTDYKNSGYDRGHLSRANYNKRSAKAYEECFYMSNMSPQVGVHFNRSGGAWFKAEELEEKLAKENRVIYGVSGPVFDVSTTTVNTRKKITVPKAYFKVILYKDSSDEWKALGYLFPNKADTNQPETFKVPIRSIEKRTGLDFNCWMTKEEQDALEGN